MVEEGKRAGVANVALAQSINETTALYRPVLKSFSGNEEHSSAANFIQNVIPPNDFLLHVTELSPSNSVLA